ncbi:bifunctional diaminohydroxyphosphoribosylaminopyrimidine deaminase/5-amino-6-(5-phosphoribosylamino)uracil reductase RibD [Idiomarina xiamenensis]|uniref:Riboflavin biosynthesis protein RibD n=1 Tax=Idiomarina xiamenensis 10-D-4 TaxID=740709 RepID=K2KYR3_9GAMM|nr:bifunctional diaminohydroxyphosphoribosylaminopyrimidine deaminase/5-amino-6-(5-phosphoribosylamino)uracil reductase RibD [Idiomarina xiamenensis]EKE82865.1 riboflavin biosynthesis protein RibD [Idiomarina xiamenensis 10-D-4]
MTDFASAADHKWMLHALELARLGQFTTAPNPNVGCVLVKDGELVAEGWHRCAGEPHAEVHALQAAGGRARGATAYVTLEPCSHYGRTPPCADALIRAQVARVVVAMEDPNPQVAGAGLARLKAAGIDVVSGVQSAAAERLNQGFCARMRRQRPWLRVKLAASLDGATALANGESQWITGGADVQVWRAKSHAILTGADTVLMDDPQLTVRLNEWPKGVCKPVPEQLRQPIKVVVDSRQRVTRQARIYQHQAEVWRASPSARDAQDLVVPQCGQFIDLALLMQQLAERGINELWSECGPRLAGALLAQQLVDELIIYQAPKLMGASARQLLQLPQFEQMDEVPELDIRDVRYVGTDLRIIAQPRYSLVKLG